jgi:ubiquinone biosynthesis protein Coq4
MKPVYFILRRNRKPWQITYDGLARMPQGTLGYDLAQFLYKNEIALMPRAEFHDVYHVLFNYGTTMKEETCIQFIPFGNGRFSIPHIVTNTIALALYPESWGDFYNAFRKGRSANRFHDWDFELMLHMKTDDVRKMIFSK